MIVIVQGCGTDCLSVNDNYLQWSYVSMIVIAQCFGTDNLSDSNSYLQWSYVSMIIIVQGFGAYCLSFFVRRIHFFLMSERKENQNNRKWPISSKKPLSYE